MNDAAYTDVTLRELGLTKLGQLRSGGLPDSAFVMGCCAAIKRDLIELCLPIPDDFPSHDDWLVMFAEGMGRRVIISDVLQWYRRHDSNESQAIFNKTTKLTRWEVFKGTLSQFVITSRRTREEAVSNSTDLRFEAVLNGIDKAIQKAISPYREELEKMSGQLKEKHDMYLERRAIRQQPRALRVGSVIRLWGNGTYKHYSGLRSAIRDLIFD